MTLPPIHQLRVAVTTSDYKRLVKFYCMTPLTLRVLFGCDNVKKIMEIHLCD